MFPEHPERMREPFATRVIATDQLEDCRDDDVLQRGDERWLLGSYFVITAGAGVVRQLFEVLDRRRLPGRILERRQELVRNDLRNHHRERRAFLFIELMVV